MGSSALSGELIHSGFQSGDEYCEAQSHRDVGVREISGGVCHWDDAIAK